MQHTHRRRGQALVESIAALSVLVIGFMGLFSLYAQSTGIQRQVGDSYRATYLAAEGIEVAKNLIAAASSTTGVDLWDPSEPSFRCTNGSNLIPCKEFEVTYDTDMTVANGPVRVNGNCTNNPGRPLQFVQASGLYSYDPAGSETSYRRCIEVDRPHDNAIKVTAFVRWTTRGGGSFETRLEDYVYQWK